MNLSLTVQLSQILTTLRFAGRLPARVHPEEYDSRHSPRLAPEWIRPYIGNFPNSAAPGSPKRKGGEV
jgi:hypothetical protein